MLEALRNADAFTLISLGIAILGIILTIYFYFKSKNTRKPTFAIKSNNLVKGFSKKLDKLQMIYDKKNIENLTVSRVTFWNDGDTIEWSHTVEDDPPRIEACGGAEILDAYTIQQNNETRNFHVSVEENKLVKIRFNFLEKGEGGVIQIIHTGISSSSIKICGHIKGAGQPVSNYETDLLWKIFRKLQQSESTPADENPTRQRRFFGIGLVSYGIFFISVLIASSNNPANLVVGIFFILILTYIAYSLLKRRLPKGLELGEEESNFFNENKRKESPK